MLVREAIIIVSLAHSFPPTRRTVRQRRASGPHCLNINQQSKCNVIGRHPAKLLQRCSARYCLLIYYQGNKRIWYKPC